MDIKILNLFVTLVGLVPDMALALSIRIIFVHGDTSIFYEEMI